MYKISPYHQVFEHQYFCHILLYVRTWTKATNWIESASGIRSATIESRPQFAKPWLQENNVQQSLCKYTLPEFDYRI